MYAFQLAVASIVRRAFEIWETAAGPSMQIFSAALDSCRRTTTGRHLDRHGHNTPRGFASRDGVRVPSRYRRLDRPVGDRVARRPLRRASPPRGRRDPRSRGVRLVSRVTAQQVPQAQGVPQAGGGQGEVREDDGAMGAWPPGDAHILRRGGRGVGAPRRRAVGGGANQRHSPGAGIPPRDQGDAQAARRLRVGSRLGQGGSRHETHTTRAHADGAIDDTPSRPTHGERVGWVRTGRIWMGSVGLAG